MFAAELRRLTGDVRSPALQSWHDALVGACISVSNSARRTCRTAAVDRSSECSFRISESLAKDPRHDDLTSKFPEAGIFLDADEEDSVLRGFYLSVLEEREADPEEREGSTQVFCNYCSLVTALAPLLAAELRGAGLAVEVQPAPVACGGWSQEAPDLLILSWAAATASLTCTGNVVHTCGICQDSKPMEALLPCGHLLCAACCGEIGSLGCCPFCRCRVIGTQALFAP